MANDVEILVNGMSYRGWESVAVTRAIDAASGAFTLTVTETWSDNQDQPWPIFPGDSCEVRIDGEAVIVGYVDMFSPSFDAGQHTINIQGRDKTADLIDCSAVHSPDEWRNFTVLDLARTLAEPFGISVKADVGVGDAFSVVKLQQGETALEAIDRHCKLRKLLAMPDGKGGLLITRTGHARATVQLIQGQNIKSASGRIDFSQRYSDYTVKAQAAYSAETDGEGEAHIVGSVRDSGVKRYRPLLVVAEGGGTTQTAKDRAVWECNTRIGKAASVSIDVQGWRQGQNLSLWRPNQIVTVDSSWLRLHGDMLIRQVTYKRDNSSGTVATLELVSPQSFEVEPPKEKKKKAGGDKNQQLWEEALAE